MSRREIPLSELTMHAGSPLRPPELSHARAEFKAGRIDGDELRAVEDEAILGAMALQRDAGLQTVTDGEFRRTSWHMDFIYSLGGIEQVAGRDDPRAVSQRRGRVRLRAAGDARDRHDRAAADDLRRGV